MCRSDIPGSIGRWLRRREVAFHLSSSFSPLLIHNFSLSGCPESSPSLCAPVVRLAHMS